MFLRGNIRVGILPMTLVLFCIGLAIIFLVVIIVKKNKEMHSHMLDVSRLTKKNQSLTKQNNELTKEKKSHLAQISKVSSDKENINRKLKSCQNKVEQLEKDNLQLRTENKNANNVFIQTKQALDEKDSLSVHLSQQLESVNAEFHKLKSEYTALDKKQQEKEEIIQQQANTLDGISAEKEQNEKQNKELAQKIESLKQYCSDLGSRLKESENLQSQNEALRKKLLEKDDIIQQQSNSLDTISADKEENERQNKELVQEIESLKQRCSDLESKLKEFENQQNYLAAETENPFERLARW